MSVTHLKLHTSPEVPLETEVINPSVFASLSQSGIERLKVMHGNVKCNLGDFFKVTGKGASEILIEGDLSRIKLIGAGMSEGKIIVERCLVAALLLKKMQGIWSGVLLEANLLE